MRTVQFPDRDVSKLLSILRKEFFTPYTTHKEKADADRLYLNVTNSRWEPDPQEAPPAHEEDDGLFEFVPDGWREVEA